MDLFNEKPHLTKLPIKDGEVFFLENCPLSLPPEKIFNKLLTETPWLTEKISIWGKIYIQPRLIAWYGDPNKYYKYSGNTFKPLPWTELLLSVKNEIEKLTDEEFNSVLLNYYRDGNDSMGFHSDDEPELGENPVIASLSLGESRTFVFKHKRNKEIKNYKITLKNGTLVLMKEGLQDNWQHGIPKESNKGPRINLTFRYIN